MTIIYLLNKEIPFKQRNKVFQINSNCHLALINYRTEPPNRHRFFNFGPLLTYILSYYGYIDMVYIVIV